MASAFLRRRSDVWTATYFELTDELNRVTRTNFDSRGNPVRIAALGDNDIIENSRLRPVRAPHRRSRHWRRAVELCLRHDGQPAERR